VGQVANLRTDCQSVLLLYEARLDKGYSLTDCISMETMRYQGITDVLTNDAHFEQEGFHALFRQF
jgi:predicted nucleic acid-binding protein